jgi:hypothetical protein
MRQDSIYVGEYKIDQARILHSCFDIKGVKSGLHNSRDCTVIQLYERACGNESGVKCCRDKYNHTEDMLTPLITPMPTTNDRKICKWSYSRKFSLFPLRPSSW